MEILLFAQAKDIAGCDRVRLDICEPISIDQLWDALIASFPGLAPLRRAARIARNGHYATSTTRLEPGDEVAVIPPVSGG